MRKRTISLVLALLMVFTLLPVAASADGVASGKCGDNLTWTLSSAGELTISGTGDMYKYSTTTPAWNKGAIKSIVVKSGVTSIGDNAFYGCSALTTITLPLSLKKIGTNAFGECTATENIYYEGSIKQWKNIETYAGDLNDGLVGVIIHFADPSDPFPDIQGWFHDSILRCYLEGVINGYPDGTFGPDNNVTRVQFIMMLYNMCGKPDVDKSALPFSDSGKIHSVYWDAIRWGVANDIIKGYSDGTFRADENISRAQMATFAYRLLDSIYGDALDKFDTESSFTDAAQVLGDYKTPVNVMSSLGIITGYPDGSFGPNNTATRGQAATIFVRIMDFVYGTLD